MFLFVLFVNCLITSLLLFVYVTGKMVYSNSTDYQIGVERIMIAGVVTTFILYCVYLRTKCTNCTKCTKKTKQMDYVENHISFVPDENLAFYRTQIQSVPNVPDQNLDFYGNQIPSVPNVPNQNLASYGTQIRSVPNVPNQNLASHRTQIRSVPNVPDENLAFYRTQIQSVPNVPDQNLDFYGNQIPSVPNVPDQNLAFYGNQIPSVPNGDYIENILIYWTGNYHLLETHHGYIQWLFPNHDPGVNSKASILTDKEAKIIRETPEMRNRVRRAFEMMLDFYGMRLTRENQFQLSENFYERLSKLNQRGNHNFLRITRILNGLKELGHKDLMLPWMKFLARQIYREERLDQAESSFLNYWIETLDALDKIELLQFMENVEIVTFS